MISRVYIYDFIALLLLILIFVSDKRMRKSNRLDDICFIRIGLIFFLMIVVDLFSAYGLSHWNDKLGQQAATALDDLTALIHLINCFFWYIFVDAAVYNRKERIKERYRRGFFPLLYIFSMICLKHLIMDMDNRSLQYLWVGVFLVSYVGIALFFIVEAYRMAHSYQKEIQGPMFFRLDIFIIPWALGFFIQNDLDIPFTAIGVVLTYAFIRRRDRYLDEKMTFYNENFIDYYDEFERKNGIRGGYAIILSSEDEDILADALSKCTPENSVVIRDRDGDFIVYTRIRLKSAIQVFIITLQDEAVRIHPDINIEVQYLLQAEGETVKEITQRLKTKLKTYDSMRTMKSQLT